MRVIKHIGNKKIKSNIVSSLEEGKKEIRVKEDNIKSYLKRNGNYIRKNKDDDKFTFINTTKYKSVFEEWIDYSDYAYTNCGKNSRERECIIIDCDDSDFGFKTNSLLNKTPIIYNYQRTKENGHSQTAIFIDKVYVRNPSFKRKVVCQSEIFSSKQWNYIIKYEDFIRKQEIFCSPKTNEKTLIDVNRLYLTTVKLLNANFNGDLGFTGYCCQNPYSNADNGSVTWIDMNHKYSLADIFCIALEHTVNKTLNQVRKAHAHNNRTVTKELKEYYEVIEEEQILVKEQLSNISKNITDAYKNSIDGAIFKFIADLKSYTYRCGKKLTYQYAMVSILKRKDITKDYDYLSIEEHVLNSVDYINEHFNPSLSTYTDTQRNLSDTVRKVESLKKWFEIKSLLRKGYSHKEIAKRLDISTKTVQRLSKKTYEDFDVESLKESLAHIKKYRDLYRFLIRTVEKNQVNENTDIQNTTESKDSYSDNKEYDLDIKDLVSCILAG